MAAGKLGMRASRLFCTLALATLVSSFYSLYLTLVPLSSSALPSALSSKLSNVEMLLSSRALLRKGADAAAGAVFPPNPNPGVSKQQLLETELSIYSVPNLCVKWQSIWVYNNLCFNGSHMLTLGEEVKCREAERYAKNGSVVPAACGSGLYRQRVKLRPEIKIPEASRGAGWLESRSKVEWRRGASSVIYLDSTAENVAHFIGKVNMLLAMNNASVPGLTERVARFMFYSHEKGRAIWDKLEANKEAFHPTYLAMLLSRVLQPLGGRDVEPEDLLGSASLQDGKVEMEAPFAAASEARPLCFETAVLPGFLKRSFWPGSLPVADAVRSHLARILSPPPDSPSNSAPLLLYVVRTSGWRVFFPSTEARFRELLQRQDADVRIADFQTMSFREQFWSVQQADITVSIHGANLVNPSMFSRRNSVLIEIVPYHIVHRMYESQAIDSGLIYMSHQCEQGKPQAKDRLFSSFTYQACIDSPACKFRFIKNRRIELAPGDMLQLDRLLSLAQHITRRLSSLGLRNANDGRLTSVIHSLLPEGLTCLPYSARDNLCRRSWITWNDGHGSRICYLNEVCGEFPAPLQSSSL